MKKITAKEKLKNVPVIPALDPEETTPEEAHVAAELDPDILKVFIKPKKSKNTIDTTDYIPELERGDTDEEQGLDARSF